MAVSFEPKDHLVQLSRQMQLPFPLLSETRKDAYRAYGLTAGSFRRVWAWGTVWAYLELTARDHQCRFRCGEVRQMGGDFVLDLYGTVVYEFRGASPRQCPAIDEPLDVLDRSQEPD